MCVGMCYRCGCVLQMCGCVLQIWGFVTGEWVCVTYVGLLYILYMGMLQICGFVTDVEVLHVWGGCYIYGGLLQMWGCYICGGLIQMWGCGGQSVLKEQLSQKQWEQKESDKQKNRKVRLLYDPVYISHHTLPCHSSVYHI